MTWRMKERLEIPGVGFLTTIYIMLLVCSISYNSLIKVNVIVKTGNALF